MMTITLFESMDLTVLAAYGFIALNMFLSGAYLVWRGFEKLVAPHAAEMFA